MVNSLQQALDPRCAASTNSHSHDMTEDNTAEIAACWGDLASAKLLKVFTRKHSDVLQDAIGLMS